MAQTLALAVRPRDVTIKAKALRRQNVVPAVVYGHGFPPRSIQIDYLPAERIVRMAGTSHLIDLDIEGDTEEHTVLIRDVQYHPVTGRIMHMDFYHIVAGEEIRNQVPVVLVGEAPVAKTLGATVTQTLEHIEIQCLPQDMPGSIEFDLSVLTELHARVTVADLPIPEKVTVLTDPEMEVLQIAAPRLLEEEEEEVEEAVLEGEAAEAAEVAEEAASQEEDES